MTVKELIKELSKYPDNMDVFIAERKTEFRYGLANSAYVKEIFFTEDEFPTEDEIKQAPREEVLIIDEE